MTETRGTPTSLHEAIHRELCIGPLRTVEARLFAAVRDFLAQRFGAAVLNNEAAEKELMNLFESIVADSSQASESPTRTF